nr:MAG TPA: hypothetical protein [Caudoviricetes sp.]
MALSYFFDTNRISCCKQCLHSYNVRTFSEHCNFKTN